MNDYNPFLTVSFIFMKDPYCVRIQTGFCSNDIVETLQRLQISINGVIPARKCLFMINQFVYHGCFETLDNITVVTKNYGRWKHPFTVTVNSQSKIWGAKQLICGNCSGRPWEINGAVVVDRDVESVGHAPTDCPSVKYCTFVLSGKRP